MAITNTTRGGVIGLGSRLFLRKESGWGEPKKGSSFATDLALTDREQYNVYNQAGSRPQKVKNSIEVSQMYPSVVRRKTIKNTTTYITVNITTFDNEVYTFSGIGSEIVENPDFIQVFNREMNRVYRTIQKTNK